MAIGYTATTTADELVARYASSIKDKTILTTGVSPAGLGAAFVQAVAQAKPKLLILAGRDDEKLEQTAAAVADAAPGVATRKLVLDLNSLAQVREAARMVVDEWADVPVVDVLVCNAGVMATDYGKTEDGLERQFGINHVGHFLFVNLLMGKVLKAEKPRVVVVSSDGHRLNPMRWADYGFDNGKTYNKWHAYGQSKTANMLMAISLAEKLGGKGLRSFSLHPGVVEGTSLGSRIDWAKDYPALNKAMGNPEGWKTEFKYLPQAVGVATHVYAAFEPSLNDHNGEYLLQCRLGDPLADTIKPWATSAVEAERLWKLSEELVGQKFEY